MNESQLLPDDPKLTAYALGELTGDERAAVEAALRRDPALRILVDEIRGTAAQLESALADEPVPFEKPPVAARFNRYRIWRRRATRRAVVQPRPADDERDEYARPRRGTLLNFPQFYYVIGGLAAACFALFVALRPGEIEARRQPAPATSTALASAQKEREQRVIVSVPLAPPAVADTAVTSAPSPAVPTEAAIPVAVSATRAQPSFVGGSLALLEQTKHEASHDTDAVVAGAVAPIETARTDATHLAADASATGAAPATPASNDAVAAPVVASASPSPGSEPPRVTFAGVVPNPDATPSPAFRGFGAPATGAAPTPSMAARNTLSATDDPTARAEHREPVRASVPQLASLSRGAASRLTHTANTVTTGATSATVSAAPSAGSDDVVVLSAFEVSGERAGGASAALMATQRLSERESLPRPPRGAKFARSGEAYSYMRDNDFLSVALNPVSTFAADVDTASYSIVRRFIESGTMPPRDAVRIEEMLNYFPYRYPAPTRGTEPFAAALEVSEAPWEPTHRLVRVGLKARDIPSAERPAANLVFLLDVSASMEAPNKLPLVKEALRMLVQKLRADDRVAIVTYAGKSGLALAPTPAARADEILQAIEQLTPGGPAAGSAGLQLAYAVANKTFAKDGINRVILCTDGDFNLGATSEGELVRLIQEKAAGGVFLTVLGFGMGNYKDATLEKLASFGNGTYGYIDTTREAEKLLVEQVSSTLVAIAKDVKVQVQFNPAKVASYRLIGYENRLLRREDFSDDKADAGEIGAGHTLTALYEIVPVGLKGSVPAAEPPLEELRYASGDAFSSRLAMPGTERARSNELLYVTVKYKKPDGLFPLTRSLEFPVPDRGAKFAEATADFRFAAAVAQFGMILRDSPHKGNGTLGDVLAWAASAATKPADDPGGYRGEFIDLVRKAQVLLQ